MNILSRHLNRSPVFEKWKQLAEPIVDSVLSKILPNSLSLKDHVIGITNIALPLISRKCPNAAQTLYTLENISSGTHYIYNLVKSKNCRQRLVNFIKIITITSSIIFAYSDFSNGNLSMRTQVLDLTINLYNIFNSIINREVIQGSILFTNLINSLLFIYANTSNSIIPHEFFITTISLQIAIGAYQAIHEHKHKKPYSAVREAVILCARIKLLKERFLFLQIDKYGRHNRHLLYESEVREKLGKEFLTLNHHDPSDKFIIATAAEDYNGALYPASSDLIRTMKNLGKTFDVKYLTAFSLRDIEKSINQIPRNVTIAGVMIRAHGNPESMFFSNENQGLFMKQYIAPDLFPTLDKKSVIILTSCATAGGKVPEESIAYRIAQASGKTTYAANNSVNDVSIEIDPTTHDITAKFHLNKIPFLKNPPITVKIEPTQ
jgi:hypothetical protein